MHDGQAQFSGMLDRGGEGKWEGKTFTQLEPVEHPVVRTHPETGAKVAVRQPWLHLAHQGARSGPRATRCSRSSTTHSVRPSTPCATTGSEGTLGFWDNRTTQHAVVGDFGDQHRVIQRVTLRGDEPV